MEVWYTEDDGRTDSKRLALLIRQQTLKSTEATERELRSDADFYVTKNTSMPACLIETGFLSNAAERRKLNLAEYQRCRYCAGNCLLFSSKDHVPDL